MVPYLGHLLVRGWTSRTVYTCSHLGASPLRWRRRLQIPRRRVALDSLELTVRLEASFYFDHRSWALICKRHYIGLILWPTSSVHCRFHQPKHSKTSMLVQFLHLLGHPGCFRTVSLIQAYPENASRNDQVFQPVDYLRQSIHLVLDQMSTITNPGSSSRGHWCFTHPYATLCSHMMALSQFEYLLHSMYFAGSRDHLTGAPCCQSMQMVHSLSCSVLLSCFYSLCQTSIRSWTCW